MPSSSTRCTGVIGGTETRPGRSCKADPRHLSDAGSWGASGRHAKTKRVRLSARAGHLAISPLARRGSPSSLQRIQSVDARKRITLDRIALLSVTSGPTGKSRTPPMPATPQAAETDPDENESECRSKIKSIVEQSISSGPLATTRMTARCATDILGNVTAGTAQRTKNGRNFFGFLRPGSRTIATPAWLPSIRSCDGPATGDRAAAVTGPGNPLSDRLALRFPAPSAAADGPSPECTPGMQRCHRAESTGWRAVTRRRLAEKQPRAAAAARAPANRTMRHPAEECGFCWTAHHRHSSKAVGQQSSLVCIYAARYGHLA